MFSVQKLIIWNLIFHCIERRLNNNLCNKINFTDFHLYYQVQQFLDDIIKVEFKGQYIL
jgi:hypothetical protein